MIPLVRRVACSAFALGACALVFHAPLADAIVTRGDDAWRNGMPGEAIRFYRRALVVNPSSSLAADRLAFQLAIRHDRVDARAARDIADRVLAFRPADPALLADRAFAELELRRFDDARRDFRQAGKAAHDARFERLARHLALRATQR
jgi:tetratricopeptide (TPR) repeat protein